MSDDLRGYVQLMAGLTEETRQRARDVAQGLITAPATAVPPGAGALAAQVAGLAEDILTAARQNRGLLLDLVRGEVERSVHTLGLATPSEVLALRQEVASLERRLADAESRVPTPAAMPPHTDTERVVVPRKGATTKAATKKAAAKKAAPRKTAAPPSTATET